MGGSDSLRIVGGSSFGRTRLPVTVVDPASSSFRLRPTWVWVSPCVGSLAVCRATCRFGSRLSSGTRRVSQVPDASLHACHALRWTPADPREPHQFGPSVLASGTVNTVAICTKRPDGAVIKLWRSRSLLRPVCFPVYASTDLFGFGPPQLQLQHSVGVDG